MEKASAMIEAKMITRVRNEKIAKAIDTRATRLGKLRIFCFFEIYLDFENVYLGD